MKSKLIILLARKACQVLKGHRLKQKDQRKPLSTGELVEQKALARVMLLAQEKTEEQICQDCLDRRCLTGSECREFARRSKAHAWEIVAEKAELN